MDPIPRAHYPHMLNADAAIWDRFIHTNPFPDAKLLYDLHVGTPAPIVENTPANYRSMILSLSTLRIDVVAMLPTETLVIEIKPRASLYAIGQVLGYALLVKRDFPHLINPTPVIITDTAAADTQWLCDRLNVTLHELD